MKIGESANNDNKSNRDLEYLINELTANNNVNTEELIQKLEQQKIDIRTLNYNVEQLNNKINKSNDYLERISWRAGCIIFLMILPMVVKLLFFIYQVNNLNQLMDLLYQ